MANNRIILSNGGKTICLEGDCEKLEVVREIVSLLGATQPDEGRYDIPETYGDASIDVFEHLWKHLNE